MDPWQVVAALIAAMTTAIGILYRAIQKGDFVAGSIYRLALKQAADERKARLLAERRANKSEAETDLAINTVREAKADLAKANAALNVALSQRERDGAAGG